jgi:hypothetical protein
MPSSALQRILALASSAHVELMTHPERSPESDYLLGAEFGNAIAGSTLGTYQAI